VVRRVLGRWSRWWHIVVRKAHLVIRLLLLLLLHSSKPMLHACNIRAEVWRLLVVVLILRVYFPRVANGYTKMRLRPLVSFCP